MNDTALHAELVDSFDQLNGSYADTVVFVARHLAADPSLTRAELVTATESSVVYEVNDDSRSLDVEVDDPITDITTFYGVFYGHLAQARAADPDGELTSLEAESARNAALPTTHVVVSAVRDLTPEIRQITLRGIEPGPDAGGDQFVYVMLPDPGQDRLPEGATMQSLRARPYDEIAPMAYYTIRRWHPETGEIDAWFVLHSHDHGVSGWAANVDVGAHCALWGPRRGFEVPDGTSQVIAFVDETGIAAAYALAESVPAVPFHVVAEWQAGTDVPAGPGLANLTIDVRWRDGEPGTASLLPDAASGMTAPDPNALVVGAAESRMMTKVRKIARNDWNLPLAQVSCVGYWRRG